MPRRPLAGFRGGCSAGYYRPRAMATKFSQLTIHFSAMMVNHLRLNGP
jgi:hypothetical protein